MVGIGLALYAGVGFLLVPQLVRSALLENMSETFTTQPTLEKVRVNPFALSLTLKRLAIPDRRGETAVGFERLYLRFNIFSPFFGAWTFDKLRLEKPVADIAVLEDRSLSLVGLLRPRPASADSMAEPPAVLIRHLQIVDGSVAYQDMSRQPSFEKALIPIQVELKDFTTRRDRRNEYSLNARTDRGETLAWSGRFTIRPFTSEGRLKVDQIQAQTIEDFMGGLPPFQFTRGTLGFGADYRFDAAETPARFELSEMGVSIRDLALADRATGEESMAAATIVTTGGAVRSDLMDASLGTVTADSLRVLVWMDSTNTTNLQRWSQAPADTAAPWVTRIVLAMVHNAEVEYQDRRLEPPAVLRMHRARAELKGYSSAPGTVVPLSAACSTGYGGRIFAEGSLVPSVGSMDLELTVEDFDLRELQPYISATSKLDITSGVVGAKGRLRFNSFGPAGPLIRFTGDVTSSRFVSVDRKLQQEFMTWQKLELKEFEYDQEPPRVFAREIVATKPFIRFVIAPDMTTSIQSIAVPPDSVPPAFRPKPDAPDTIPTVIQVVRVVDGSMYFADLSLQPNFATGIVNMNGTIKELSSAQAAHAAVELDGNVDEYAPVKFLGTLNPLNEHGLTDIAVTFQNIELTTFSPYSGKFMGYQIEKGKLDLDLHYIIQNRKLEAQNKILMRQLTLGEKVPSPEATSLPVKFAIALLKDKNGDIDLNLPVHGDLDDPKFSVIPIVMKVLVQLVIKAVTSPFKLFGAIFGGDDEEVAPAIRFPYGSAALDTTETKKLDAIQKGLSDRPNLKLEIEQASQRGRDSLAVLDLRFTERLHGSGMAPGRAKVPEPTQVAAAALHPRTGFTPTEFAQALTAAYTAQFGKLPELEKPKQMPPKGPARDSVLVAVESKRMTVMEERLRSTIRLRPEEVSGLAVERARTVQGYLLRDTTLVVERVFIVADKGTYRPDSAGVRVGLTLTD